MTDIIATLRPTQGIQCEQSILYLFDQNVANSIVETTTRQWLEDNAQQYITEYIQPILDAYEQDKEREIDAYVEEKQSTIFFDNTNFTGTTTAEVLNVTNKAYIPTINNGGDIAVPTSAGTMALTSDIAIGKNNITNCITKIPQDIKLELNNGTLTLKAGSKMYNGNGLLFTTTSDSISPNANYNGQVMIFVSADGNNSLITAFNGGTVSTLPAIETSFKAYYNTSDGKCYVDAGYWLEVSFPIAIGTSTTTSWVSIDQVFNGFGYIGSTVFALPGVEGLIPDGRNEDGTLKNIVDTVTSVRTFTNALTNARQEVLLQQEISNITISNAFYYNEPKNKIIYVANNNAYPRCVVATVITDANNKITSFIPKTAFHTVDYNDREFIGHQAMPSNRRVNLTLGASGASYTAPADGYFCLSKQSTGTQWANLINSNTDTRIFSTSQNGDYVYLFIPARKGDTIYSFYTLAGTTEFFRFSYAEGSK